MEKIERRAFCQGRECPWPPYILHSLSFASVRPFNMAYFPEFVYTMTKTEFANRCADLEARDAAGEHIGLLTHAMAELVVAVQCMVQCMPGGGGPESEEGGLALLDKIAAKVPATNPDLRPDIEVIKAAVRSHAIDLVDAVCQTFTYDELCVYGL